MVMWHERRAYTPFLALQRGVKKAWAGAADWEKHSEVLKKAAQFVSSTEFHQG